MTVSALRTERLITADHVAAAARGEGLHIVFQPVVDLSRRTVAGYEALARFDAIDGIVSAPDEWFRVANDLGLSAQLDAATLAVALARRSDLPRNCFLSVNIEPCSLPTAPVMNILRAQHSLAGLVIELTEHRPWEWHDLAPVVEELRARGAIFAMDDAGAGYSGLRQILQLRPSIVKLDRSLVHQIDNDEAKRSLVETLGIFASRIDAWILAEGIETAAEAQALVDLEVPLVQGFYFGRPGSPWREIDEASLIELRQLPQATRETLYRLVDPTPPLIDSTRSPVWTESTESTEAAEKTDGAASFVERRGRESAPTSDWSAVVDDDQRPLGLLHRRADGGGLIETLIANVHSSPSDIGLRIATAPDSEPCAPVIVVDNGGRYLGLITIRRLLRALSD